MQNLSIVILVFGAIWGISALVMDVSNPGSNVYNTGLLALRAVHVSIAETFLLGGMVLFGFSSR